MSHPSYKVLLPLLMIFPLLAFGQDRAVDSDRPLLTVRKDATLCSGNDCGLLQPEYRMECYFKTGGQMELSQFAVGTLLSGPVIPLLKTRLVLTAKDQLQLEELVKRLETLGKPQEIDGPGRTYHQGIYDFAPNDRYILTRLESDGDGWVAQYFRHGSERWAVEEASALVRLADRYCTWEFLTLTEK